MRHLLIRSSDNYVENAVECGTSWPPPSGYWKMADPDGLGWPGCVWNGTGFDYPDDDPPPEPPPEGGLDAGQVIDLVYPVGSIYVSTVATNPGTLFGVGTWAAFGAGRTLVGLNASDADFDTAEETGGAKTSTALVAHTHSITDPGHNHTQDAHGHGITDGGHNHTQNAHTHTQDAHTHTQNAHTHTQNSHSHTVGSTSSATGTSTSNLARGSTTNSGNFTVPAQTATNQNATATNQNATATNQNTTATNNSATTGLTVNNATATNQSNTTGITGTGSAGSGASFPILPPFVVVYLFKRTA